MLTRREVLIQLKRMGAEKPSSLRNYLRDFEKYMVINYGLKVVKTKKQKRPVGDLPFPFREKADPSAGKGGAL
jgi:hypothetical protein